MTTSIQPQSETSIALWNDIFSHAIEQTSQELGYDIPIAKLRVNPDSLREEEQQAVKLFDETMHEKAISKWTNQLEDIRRILAIAIESQERRAIAWSKLASIDEIAQVGLEIADSMPESGTKRQIQSFYRNHLQALDRAGVDMQEVNRLMAEPDKTIFETSRAISRVEKSDLTEPEKNDKIVEIVSDALTMPAAEIRRKYSNGKVQVPLDEYRLKDGTWLLTFVCSDQEQYLSVRKHTDEISVDYGNVTPIVLDTQDERTKNDFLTKLKIALAIIQSGEMSAADIDQDIFAILTDYGIVERNNNVSLSS